MDVSIIIVNYNTYQLVIDCIKSIYDKTSGINFEIIVVDNNSPDSSIKNISDLFPNITLIMNEINSGFGKGNNLGSKVASGKYLFFLNSDTLLINNAIFKFFQFMEMNPNVGICGGNLFSKEVKPTLSFERRLPGVIHDFDRFFYFVFSKILKGKSVSFNYENRPLKINGYVSGADLFISRNLFNTVKGFDEDFFMYYEETELTYRVQKKGYDIFVLNDAHIIHLEGGSQQGEVSKIKRQWTEDSKKKYYRKTNKKGLFLSSFLEAAISLRDKLLRKAKAI